MMRWCESSEHERHKGAPRSVPLRSAGHVGGKANVCMYAKDGCTHNYPRHGELPLPSTQISLRQPLFHLCLVILILVGRLIGGDTLLPLSNNFGHNVVALTPGGLYQL